MITVKLTEIEMRVIKDALTTDWYNAKDDGNKLRQLRITRLEEKLSKLETEDN